MTHLLAQAQDLPAPPVMLAIGIVIFLAIGLHEYAHAKVADAAGDPTPSFYGRVTLNLTKHFELMGTIMIIFTSIFGVGIGWGKPVPMNPSKMRNPRWDHFLAVLAGPLTNLLLAALFAFALRASGVSLVPPFGFLQALLFYGVVINLSLCLFNLLPIGPLDGMWLLGTFLPEPTRLKWTRWNLTAGAFVFIAIILVGQLSNLHLISNIIQPPLWALFRLLTGLRV